MSSNILAVIHIHLEDHHIIHGLAHLLQVGGNHLAGAAPIIVQGMTNILTDQNYLPNSMEVHNHQLPPSCSQLGVEVIHVLYRVHHDVHLLVVNC